MQLGLIVLPKNTAELEKVLSVLGKLGVEATNLGGGNDTPAKTTAAKNTPAPKEEQLKQVNADQLKTVMTRVRDELGSDTLTELLTAFGATALREVDKGDWPALVAAAEAALNGTGGGLDDDLGGLDDDLGGLDDDGFGLDDDANAPDPDEVKTAVQAYAKKHGKEKAQAVLTKNGLNTVRGLASADASTLTAILNAVS